jgi:DNA topoisomerase-2
MKPASPLAKEKKANGIKKKIVIDSDEERSGDDAEFDDLPKPPARKVAGRAAASKSKYVELSSEEEGDDSMFVDE